MMALESSQTFLPPIGLCGRAGAGKDTVAGILSSSFGYTQYRLAEAVRRELYLASTILVGTDPGGISRDGESFSAYLEGHKRDAPWLKTAWPRPLLQGWAQMQRDLRGEDYWLKRVPIGNGVVISDERYPNEMLSIKAKGGYLIFVRRDYEEEEGGNHISEMLRGCDADYVVANDGTVDDLRERVVLLVARLMDRGIGWNRPCGL